ncbi:PorT family protein [Pseudoflavitalea sp. X16]|uniref:PorT family protein n=1 Tax=Paraflavitalea devenefica TaxID=2716334 RepID=UPI001420A140|nr:PorT family protein [Paraflavitalea devenefica]NII27564.1 PorT family protein [Paraflavitalea devenefica]
MSERLPYEQQLQQQWTDIPLPDENAAWDDMARRLKEDDDDKAIVFWWRPGCGLLGVLLVILGLGWWILRPEKQFLHNGGDTGQQVTTKMDQKKSARSKHDNKPSDQSGGKNNLDHNNKPETHTNEDHPVIDSMERATKARDRRKIDKQANPEIRSVSKSKKGNLPKKRTQKNNTWRGEDTDTASMDVIKQDTPIVTKAFDTVNRADTPVDVPLKKDSVKKSRPPAAAKKEPPATDSSNKNKLFFSTGLSLQQQLPMGGQKATPYSSTGRKGSLADYIPSVFVRLNKKDKWFLQAEFKYGAPQYSKEFTYHQASIIDTGSNPRYVTNSTARLKKTFYHQLPLTFNYYVSPNWSVGGGVIWNKFYAALSDQEIIKHDNTNQTNTVVFKGLVSIKEDTSGTFASSYFQAVIESQYKWKRFSIGARYAFGLQPYIRFTLPGIGTKEEKNSSMQLFLRFELWRSKQE